METPRKAIVASLVEAIVREINCDPQFLINSGLTLKLTSQKLQQGKAGQICEHGFEGAFDVAFSVLLPFQVFRPLSADGKELPLETFSYSCALRYDIECIRERVLQNFPNDCPEFDSVLSAFIRMADFRGKNGNSHEWSPVHPTLKGLMSELATEGCVLLNGNSMYWTDNAAAAMLDAYLWPKHGRTPWKHF